MRCSSCSAVIKPIVAVDIDGTLGDYHAHFIQFAQNYLGRQLPWDYDGVGEFSDSLRLDKAEYREIKLAYRQGGMKRTMPVFHDAARFVNTMRERGIEVWVTTTRPYLRLDNIDPDTRHWLERNGIGYDGLLFNENKYERLLEIVDSGRVLAVVDDQIGHLDIAEDLGISLTILRRTQWNSHVQRGGWRGHRYGTEYDVMQQWVYARLEDWAREEQDG